MADSTTKAVLAIVVLLGVIGIVFLVRSGGYAHYKTASEEQPYGWQGECCTCTRAQLTLRGAVLPGTREVLFRNEHVEDCASACASYNVRTRNPRVQYDVNAFVSNDDVCRTSLPMGRTYGGAGGFQDQPTSDDYYVSS